MRSSLAVCTAIVPYEFRSITAMMHDRCGNLRQGYNPEYTEWYMLVNLELNQIITRSLHSHNEAADLNAQLRHTNQRWIPEHRDAYC